MPLLIQIKLLVALKFPTESTAACTVVKLQQPLWSTQRMEVVVGSIVGKFGEKLSHIDCFLSSRWWRWWPRWILLWIILEIIGDDNSSKVKRSNILKEIDAKMATIAMERGKYMPLGIFIFIIGAKRKKVRDILIERMRYF